MTAEPLFDERPGHEPRRHHDALAGRTVFVAPRRAERPVDNADAAIGAVSLEGCPFCAGNESRTPPAVLQLPVAGGGPWHARIIPNRYPVVEDFSATPRAGEQRSSMQEAHGVHDVVIESATHVRSILAVDASHWRDVWELCRQRLAMLAARGDLAWGMVFKNSGPRAGASLEHLHSQLVALDFVPPVIEAELAAASRLGDPFGDCLRRAAAEGRIVAEHGDLVALVPHALRQPFETWILPRTPEAWFHETSADRIASVAALTQTVVAQLDRLVPGADYNWWLHQAPFAAHVADRSAIASWHWHLEILPRLSGFAGFELATGCHISVLAPQESARLLREA